MHAPRPVSLVRKSALIIEAVVYGTIGAFILDRLGVPAGLISGAMLAVAAAALAGRPVPFPKLLGQATFIVLGIALGATVTPEQLHGITTYPLSVALVLIASLAIIAATTYYLRIVHGWDPVSALLGSSPGGVSQAVAVAADMKADVQGVAIVQTFRAIMTAVAVAPVLAVLDLLPPILGSGAPAPAALLPLALTVVIATIAAIAFLKLRFPGGLLFGAMIGSAALHGTGWVHGGLPIWLRDIAMIFIGTMIGGRLANISLRIFVSYLAAAVGSIVVAAVIAALFIALSIAVVAGPPAGTIIAFVPGAADTMMILALAMAVNPVFVGAHHIARIFMISLLMPMLVRVLFGKAPPDTPPRGEPLD